LRRIGSSNYPSAISFPLPNSTASTNYFEPLGFVYQDGENFLAVHVDGRRLGAFVRRSDARNALMEAHAS